MYQNILVVEDNLELRERLTFSLEKSHYNVFSVATAEDGLEILYNQKIDLLILDILLPKMNGDTFLKKIPSHNKELKTIIISAIADEDMQKELYGKNIDEYVIKPFSTTIFLLKVKAVLNRSANSYTNSTIIEYKGIYLETNNYSLTYKNQKIDLTVREFDILQLLLKNQGRIFSREDILITLWGYNYWVDERAVDVHIKNIRKKLDLDIIKTVKGVGYRIEKENQTK